MLARLVLGAVTAGAMVVPALAGMMNADEARKFVAGTVFAFTCFDGTRGAGRIMGDLGAAGSSARPSRVFRSSRASISTSRMIALSAAPSRAWVSPIAISVTRARRRC